MENVTAGFGQWFGLSEQWEWVAELTVVVTIVVLINFAVRIVLSGMKKAVDKTDNVWDDALINAVGPPLRMIVWVIGISIAAHLAASQVDSDEEILGFINTAREAGIIACIVWFLLRLINGVQDNVAERAIAHSEHMDKHTAEAIGKLIRAVVMIVGALVVMQTFGFSVSGVLAFGGVGGIAIGFAARDMLANFFGGLMIYLDKPFSVGDWIRSPDRQIEGTVENIGWRRTMVRKFDKRPLYIPNSVFTTICVENPSRMTNRRIYETIGVRYCDADKVAEIVEDIKAMLRAHDEIDQQQTMIVNFNAFNDSSLDFFVYTFTKTTVWVDYHEIKQDVMMKIYAIIQDNGGDCAFPSTSVYVEALPEGKTA